MTGERRDPSAEQVQRYLLVGLTLGLVAWGAYLAVGSFLGGANLRGSAARGLVIFGCVAGFLGFWWLLLMLRKHRPPQNRS
jgi:hypothetical protein